jgi:hypothetical protein
MSAPDCAFRPVRLGAPYNGAAPFSAQVESSMRALRCDTRDRPYRAEVPRLPGRGTSERLRSAGKGSAERWGLCTESHVYFPGIARMMPMSDEMSTTGQHVPLSECARDGVDGTLATGSVLVAD